MEQGEELKQLLARYLSADPLFKCMLAYSILTEEQRDQALAFALELLGEGSEMRA